VLRRPLLRRPSRRARPPLPDGTRTHPWRARYLNPSDRVLIIDDFLAGGRTADALVRLCKMANANVVGGGFLIEKAADAGRAFLSGYQIPLESIALVEVKDGTIHVIEQDSREAPAQLQSEVAAVARNFDDSPPDDDDDGLVRLSV
jgi:hypothetical protein